MKSVEQLKKQGRYPLPYDKQLPLVDNIRRDIALAGKVKKIILSPRSYSYLAIYMIYNVNKKRTEIFDFPVEINKRIRGRYKIIEA